MLRLAVQRGAIPVSSQYVPGSTTVVILLNYEYVSYGKSFRA